LPTGESLAQAIGTVDAATGNSPAYYMINCAHPTHFNHVLDADGAWIKRIRGLRANSSRCSHAELDNAPELDMGNPHELGGQYANLVRRFPHIRWLLRHRSPPCALHQRGMSTRGLSILTSWEVVDERRFFSRHRPSLPGFWSVAGVTVTWRIA